MIEVSGFHMAGRKFRNLRQAVNRTYNAGVTTAVVAEADLDETLREELADVVKSAPRGTRTERGFSMILDGTLCSEYPGLQIIFARDRQGVIQGFQQYAVAGGGSDVSMDIPWRRRGAPNGIDERLSVDMVQWAKSAGAKRISLAFAPFTDIFCLTDGTPDRRMLRKVIHLGDAFIQSEALYRYLRKFNALGARRYVLVPMRQLASVLPALLILEFAPRLRRFPPEHRDRRTNHTRRCLGLPRAAPHPRATITGTWDSCATAVLTDPSISPVNPPRPRLPTTSTCARTDSASNC